MKRPSGLCEWYCLKCSTSVFSSVEKGDWSPCLCSTSQKRWRMSSPWVVAVWWAMNDLPHQLGPNQIRSWMLMVSQVVPCRWPWCRIWAKMSMPSKRSIFSGCPKSGLASVTSERCVYLELNETECKGRSHVIQGSIIAVTENSFVGLSVGEMINKVRAWEAGV